MALVRRRDGCTVGDLLVAVGDVGVQPVVVDSDIVVGIAGGESDLDVGGEEVGDGGVEGIEGDVLEDEGRFGWPENGPDYENDEEDDEEEDEGAGEDEAEDFVTLAFVVVTNLLRHGVVGRMVGEE